jgi:hypothetical protein
MMAMIFSVTSNQLARSQFGRCRGIRLDTGLRSQAIIESCSCRQKVREKEREANYIINNP